MTPEKQNEILKFIRYACACGELPLTTIIGNLLDEQIYELLEEYAHSKSIPLPTDTDINDMASDKQLEWCKSVAEKDIYNNGDSNYDFFMEYEHYKAGLKDMRDLILEKTPQYLKSKQEGYTCNYNVWSKTNCDNCGDCGKLNK
jgi:hypothetical protein